MYVIPRKQADTKFRNVKNNNRNEDIPTENLKMA